jgi:hypothetical protein
VQKTKPLIFISILAAISLAIGILLTAQTIRKTPVKIDRMNQKIARFKAIQALEKSAQDEIAAVEAYNNLSPIVFTPIEEIIKRSLPGVKIESQPIQIHSAAEGWELVQASIILKNVELANVAQCIALAEKQRPPWRMRECQIIAVDNNPGYGRVQIGFETLRRKETKGSL